MPACHQTPKPGRRYAPSLTWVDRSAESTFGIGAGHGRVAVTFVAVADANVAARHDGGNRVLVDHLADLVAQQHNELVKRFDRALQLDAVDQVDRYRDTLPAQCVQKRILQ